MTLPGDTHAPPMNRAERRSLAAKSRDRTPRRCACCAPDVEKHEHAKGAEGRAAPS